MHWRVESVIVPHWGLCPPQAPSPNLRAFPAWIWHPYPSTPSWWLGWTWQPSCWLWLILYYCSLPDKVPISSNLHQEMDSNNSQLLYFQKECVSITFLSQHALLQPDIFVYQSVNHPFCSILRLSETEHCDFVMSDVSDLPSHFLFAWHWAIRKVPWTWKIACHLVLTDQIHWDPWKSMCGSVVHF